MILIPLRWNGCIFNASLWKSLIISPLWPLWPEPISVPMRSQDLSRADWRSWQTLQGQWLRSGRLLIPSMQTAGPASLYMSVQLMKKRIYSLRPGIFFGHTNTALKTRMAASQGMHVSPAKHSYVWPKKAWLPRKFDNRKDRQMYTEQSDPYMPLYFAGYTKTAVC